MKPILAWLADRLGRHPALVVLLAVAVAAGAGVYGGSVSNRLDPYGFEDPSEERVKAADQVEAATGVDPEPPVVVLIEGNPVRTPSMRSKVGRVERLVERGPYATDAVTYYESQDQTMVSRDRRATYVLTYMGASSRKEQQEAAAEIRTRLSSIPGVEVGGEAAANAEIEQIISEDLTRAELVALPVVFLLSVWFFRGVAAALLPPLLGGLTIVLMLALLRLVNQAVPLSVFALNLTTGLGLGLAIDYTLLIVSRYREELAVGGPATAALHRTLVTAGRTVVFSALTVALALSSLLVFPQRFLSSMGVAGIATPLVAAGTAVTLLPAILILLGERVNALAPAFLRRLAARESRPTTSGGWYRLSRFVMRRPIVITIISAAALIALAAPVTGIRFSQLDARVLPDSADAKRVFSELGARFPAAGSSPILVVLDTPVKRRADEFALRIRQLDGIIKVSRPQRLKGSGTRLDVISRFDPLSERSQDLVREIRSIRAPFEVLVGGESAAQIDQKQSLVRHLPLAVAIAVGATLILLFLVTRSLLLPIKQALMNVLVVSTAFGFLVFFFQHGRLEGLLGYQSAGGLELSLPVLLGAVVFGLATDYGVFLFARIKETRDRGESNADAVAIGLERTGRIVTAAALLFAVAIGALAASRIAYIKQLGLGIAFAVLVDATLVRGLLVPSLMQLFGRWNWWTPRLRLRRRVHELSREK